MKAGELFAMSSIRCMTTKGMAMIEDHARQIPDACRG
jgi:hypothetical protein